MLLSLLSARPSCCVVVFLAVNIVTAWSMISKSIAYCFVGQSVECCRWPVKQQHHRHQPPPTTTITATPTSHHDHDHQKLELGLGGGGGRVWCVAIVALVIVWASFWCFVSLVGIDLKIKWVPGIIFPSRVFLRSRWSAKHHHHRHQPPTTPPPPPAEQQQQKLVTCLLYTSPSPRD